MICLFLPQNSFGCFSRPRGGGQREETLCRAGAVWGRREGRRRAKRKGKREEGHERRPDRSPLSRPGGRLQHRSLLRRDHSKAQPTGAGLSSGFMREKGGDPRGQNRAERGLRAAKTLRTPRPRCEPPQPGFEPAPSRPAAAPRLRRATAPRGGA